MCVWLCVCVYANVCVGNATHVRVCVRLMGDVACVQCMWMLLLLPRMDALKCAGTRTRALSVK